MSSGWAGDIWTWLMGLLGRSGDTLVDIVSDIFTGISSAISAIKTAAEEFVAGVKAAGEYIVKGILNLVFESIELGVNNFIYAVGKILQVFQPDLNVIKGEFISLEQNGISNLIGFKNDNFDIDLKLGIIQFSLRDLFECKTILQINDHVETLGSQGDPSGSFNPFKIPEGFSNIAWKYIGMELLKEIVLTLSFSVWQLLVQAKKSLLAMAVHTTLLAASVIGSDVIFNKIKNDNTLSPEEKHATIYQLYNIHLDLVLGGVMDLGLELFNEITTGGDRDLTNLGYALDALPLNYLQGRISQSTFMEWNPTALNIWSTDFSNMDIATILEGFLLIFGGWQISYLFDTGYATIAQMSNLVSSIGSKTPTKIAQDLIQIGKTLILGSEKDNQLQIFDFGYEKFLFGALLVFYHYTLTYYWGHSIGRL